MQNIDAKGQAEDGVVASLAREESGRLSLILAAVRRAPALDADHWQQVAQQRAVDLPGSLATDSTLNETQLAEVGRALLKELLAPTDRSRVEGRYRVS